MFEIDLASLRLEPGDWLVVKSSAALSPLVCQKIVHGLHQAGLSPDVKIILLEPGMSIEALTPERRRALLTEPEGR